MIRAWLLAALALSAPGRAGSGAPVPHTRGGGVRTVTVFAAASLTDAFTELGLVLERRTPGLRVRCNFAGSQQLVAQLVQGASADLLATADRRSMQAAIDHGLVTGEPVVFARNRLVVLLPAANPGHVDRLEDLARPGLKLVLAAPSVPAGRYSRDVLAKLAAVPGFPADYARRALANVVSEEENVKGVVAKVQLGEADAGMAYRSDVSAAVAARTRLLDVPDERNALAEYPMAIATGAADRAGARAFIALVSSAEGQRVLARHGLVPGPAPAGAQ